jgi:hypothetical protein
MLVSEITQRVKRQFGDEAGAQITDADIIRWINDAQRDIAHNNNLLQTTATTPLVSSQDQYTLPPDLLTLRSVRCQGRKLSFLSPEEASDWVGGDTAVGEPTHYSVWGAKIDLYPTPSRSDSDDLQLYYTRQPVAVTLLTEEPELPQQYHNRIVEYCIAQAFELDDNFESSKYKMQQFQDGIDRLKENADWQVQDVYPSITVSQADFGDSYGYGGYY